MNNTDPKCSGLNKMEECISIICEKKNIKIGSADEEYFNCGGPKM